MFKHKHVTGGNCSEEEEAAISWGDTFGFHSRELLAAITIFTNSHNCLTDVNVPVNTAQVVGCFSSFSKRQKPFLRQSYYFTSLWQKKKKKINNSNSSIELGEKPFKI